jgi:DNA-directed RNA polymerase subunit RPC12/RpoP
MALIEDDVFCSNCGELLFRVLRADDGPTVMKERGLEPESDGVQKYFRCPTCHGKNLAMLIEDPPGSYYYDIAGFIRS